MRTWIGVSLLLVLTNLTTAALVWFPNRHCDYARAEACGLRRLQTLQQQLAPGISEATLLRLSQEHGLRATLRRGSPDGSAADSRHYQIDFSQPCPASGRPYCGYTASFRHGVLLAVEDGSPCH